MVGPMTQVRKVWGWGSALTQFFFFVLQHFFVYFLFFFGSPVAIAMAIILWQVIITGIMDRVSNSK